MSTMRAELLEITGQSSLPHIFINGKHVGGLFTGSPDGSYPGLAGLKESGELQKMVAEPYSGGIPAPITQEETH